MEDRLLFGSVITKDSIPDNDFTIIRLLLNKIVYPYVKHPGIVYFLEYTTDSGTYEFRITDKNFDFIKGKNIFYLRLTGYIESNISNPKNPHVLSIFINYGKNNTYTMIEASIKKYLFGQYITSKIQKLFSSIFIRSFRKYNGVYGYITLDYVYASGFGVLSPYERYFALQSPKEASYLNLKTRGYYWGNLLNTDHIQLIGGLEAIKQSKIYFYKNISNIGLYLQLTNNVNHICLEDREELKYLKEIFLPILPAVERSYISYVPEKFRKKDLLPDLLVWE